MIDTSYSYMLMEVPQQKTRSTRRQLLDGIYGLLVGDACGVPYEFRRHDEIPRFDELGMFPPRNYLRTYAHVPLGTWSDDGAQALCLYVSLTTCGHYHPHDFASRLVKWHDNGYMAVNRYVFDIGNQTSVSIGRLKKGQPTSDSGLAGERNNGNGSLMRCLPLALLHDGNDVALVIDAHRQSRLTHRHLRSQICCALYCLWARRELQGHTDPWESAVSTARRIYSADPLSRHELEKNILGDTRATGSGYVVDSLHSARLSCREKDYASIIRRAISFGNDTDTTACLAGGIAGIRHGIGSIPDEWMRGLQGKEILEALGLGLGIY